MNLWLLGPEIVVATAAAVVLVIDLLLPASKSRKGLGVLGAVAVLLALALTLINTGNTGEAFGGLLVVDTLSFFFKIVFLLAALLVFLFSFSYLEGKPISQGEFYLLVLTALLGMMITAAAQELVTIYVGIELLSLSFYALVGFIKGNRMSAEAALKYFILGSFAIGIWLYGATLLYGLTGSTMLTDIGAALSGQAGILSYVAMILMVVGFGFKMGLAPFHQWVPDTYEGAPTPVTAYLAVGSKAAGFAVFLRVMTTVFASMYVNWVLVLGVIAVITMVWGNVAALFQTNMKRLLAYSGVAHAGYTLVGIVALNQVGVEAVMVYLFGYLFATLGAFAVVIAVTNRSGSDRIADYAGLRWRNPFLALSLTLCLLSLAGIPPLVGFFGKLYLFIGAAQQGGWLLTLVIIAAINSAISLFYYVNVIRTVYFLQPQEETRVTASVGVNATVVVALAGLLLAVFYFQPLIGSLDVTALLSMLP